MFNILFHICFTYKYLPIRTVKRQTNTYINDVFIQSFLVFCTSLDQTSRMEINVSVILIFSILNENGSKPTLSDF